MINESLEKQLKEKVLPIVEKGRPGWNLPHTLATVYWMKQLVSKEGGNEDILVTAAYMHDIGYAGLINEKGYSIDQVFDKKELHMTKGADMAEELLKGMGIFNILEILKVKHLVYVHDRIHSLGNLDEQLLFEADTLGQIDSERVPYTLNKEDYTKFYNMIVTERGPLFKTKSGKKYFKKLLEKLIKPEDYELR